MRSTAYRNPDGQCSGPGDPPIFIRSKKASGDKLSVPPAAVALSAALALAEAWGGLTLAYYTDWPTSFWITALSGMVFFGPAAARRFAG